MCWISSCRSAWPCRCASEQRHRAPSSSLSEQAARASAILKRMDINEAMEAARAEREQFEQRTIARAHELAAELTETLLPEEMRTAGFRFEYRVD